jgi:Uncharacterized conserved protein
MEKLQYKIEVFEGPLDLLLNLITKSKLNIYDIPIAELLEQYIEQIDIMRRENMDVASDFLEMAARLVHMKSVSLLPKQEEAEKLRMELTGELIEYQLCKDTAEKFGKIIRFDRMVRPAAEVELEMQYKGIHTPQELFSALMMAIGKGKSLLPPKPESFSAIVSKKIVSVTSQVVFILRKLWKKKSMPYKAVFEGKKEKSERVAVFLAILELVKGKRIYIDGDGESAKVKLLKGRGISE